MSWHFGFAVLWAAQPAQRDSKGKMSRHFWLAVLWAAQPAQRDSKGKMSWHFGLAVLWAAQPAQRDSPLATKGLHLVKTFGGSLATKGLNQV